MEECKHTCDHCCSAAPTNPSVQQNLDELDFERSIWQAAIDNDLDKIEKFSKKPTFDPNVADNYGYTPLHYAARNNCLDAARKLISLGANCNAQTGSLRATPLHRAISAKKVDMVQFLLQAGACTQIKDADGLTPLDRALKEGSTQIISMLRNK